MYREIILRKQQNSLPGYKSYKVVVTTLGLLDVLVLLRTRQYILKKKEIF